MKNSLPEVTSDFKDALMQVVAQAHQIRASIQEAIDKKGITMEHATKMFAREITEEKIKDQAMTSEDQEKTVEDHAEKAEAWARFVAQAMDKASAAYIRVLTEVGIPREQAERQCKHLFAMLIRLFLVSS